MAANFVKAGTMKLGINDKGLQRIAQTQEEDLKEEVLAEADVGGNTVTVYRFPGAKWTIGETSENFSVTFKGGLDGQAVGFDFIDAESALSFFEMVKNTEGFKGE